MGQELACSWQTGSIFSSLGRLSSCGSTPSGLCGGTSSCAETSASASGKWGGDRSASKAPSRYDLIKHPLLGWLLHFCTHSSRVGPSVHTAMSSYFLYESPFGMAPQSEELRGMPWLQGCSFTCSLCSQNQAEMLLRAFQKQRHGRQLPLTTRWPSFLKLLLAEAYPSWSRGLLIVFLHSLLLGSCKAPTQPHGAPSLLSYLVAEDSKTDGNGMNHVVVLDPDVEGHPLPPNLAWGSGSSGNLLRPIGWICRLQP